MLESRVCQFAVSSQRFARELVWRHLTARGVSRHCGPRAVLCGRQRAGASRRRSHVPGGERYMSAQSGGLQPVRGGRRGARVRQVSPGGPPTRPSAAPYETSPQPVNSLWPMCKPAAVVRDVQAVLYRRDGLAVSCVGHVAP